MIDLRSDTITRPTADMLEAMLRAEVGDDVLGDDPTVKKLEAATAGLLAKEDAVFVPSGTMANQLALRTHTQPGDWVLAEAGAHIAVLEGGMPAMLSGVTITGLAGERGLLAPEQIAAAVPRANRFMPKPMLPVYRLLAVENTHNMAGGTIWPAERLEACVAQARELGLSVHLDGARLWNAAVASGQSEADLCAPFDTVSVCFSKGLGAPVGSALAGPADFISRARRFRQMMGGSMRQAGYLAAGALFALEHNRARLADDHANAQALARRLAAIPGVTLNPDHVETNIVRFRLSEMAPLAFVEACETAGIRLIPAGPDAIRAVTSLMVSPADITVAADRIAQIMAGATA